jgi:hypothetical protein
VDVPGRRNVNSRIAAYFVKWERCPKTAGLPNPYEPWIEIWEHGGTFIAEPRQSLDIADGDHMPLGAVAVRRACIAPSKGEIRFERRQSV